MKRNFKVLIQRDADGFYVGTVPSLKGCHTQAETREQLRERLVEVIELCLEDGVQEDEDVELVAVEQVTVNAAEAKVA